jgi:ABC-type Fe3+ transport system permease subunit
MNQGLPLFQYSAAIITSLLLLLIGYFSVFQTQKVIDYTNSHSTTDLAKEWSKKKWYRINMKITGSFFLLFGLVMLVYIISTLIKDL